MKSALFFLGLLTVLTAAASGQSGDMKPTPQFARYGLKVLSTSPLSGVADVEIALTSTQDLQLAYGLMNKTAGEKSPLVSYTVEPSASGRWNLSAVFPDSADYELQLYGKAKSEANYMQVASWSVRALVPSDAVTYSRFDRYGLKVLSTSPLKGAADIDIVLHSEQNMTLAWALLNKTAGDKYAKSFTWINQSKNGDFTVGVPFPENADYELRLYGWGKGEKEDFSHPLARWNMTSAVPQDVVTYSRFDRYGLQVVSASPLKGVADVEIVLSSAEDLELASGIMNLTAGEKYVKSLMYLSRSKEGQWTVQTIFPQSGDYQLEIWGKPKGGENLVSLAKWNVRAEVPDKAATYTRFDSYGLKVSAPPTDGVAEAEFVFSSPQNLELYYHLKNKTNPEKFNSYLMFYPVNGQWRMPLFFTESGEYELSIRGKAKSEEGFSLSDLGRWSIRAEVPKGPEIRYSNFEADGLKLVSSTPLEGAEDAEIVLSSPKDLKLRASLYDLSTKTEVKGTAVASKNGKYRVAALFPRTGDYDLQLWETRTEKMSETTSTMTPYLLGRWIFHAQAESTAPRYLFEMSNAIRTFRFTAEEPAPEVKETLYDHETKRGTLAENLDLSFFAPSLSIKKGSQIVFWSKDRQIERFDTVLPAAAKLKIGDFLLDCPKGSDLDFTDTSWESEVDVNLGHDSPLTLGKQALLCTGTVHYFPEHGDFDLTLAKDTPVTIAKTRLAIPAKSRITFTGAAHHVSSVLLGGELTVTFKGESKKVDSGWIVEFDEKGAVSNVRENDYYYGDDSSGL